jgi:hypothetical protein
MMPPAVTGVGVTTSNGNGHTAISGATGPVAAHTKTTADAA